jgi:diacylglycerol kinase family enzyme
MRIALFHNPTAGDGNVNGRELVRQFQAAGFDVVYASIKEDRWEKALTEVVDRVVIAGGDGTVSRLAPWLAGRELPFCILPLGTANNCAKSLGQLHTLESVTAAVRSDGIKKLDLGIMTYPQGHRIFTETLGVGLLAASMSEGPDLKRKSPLGFRLATEVKLTAALEYLSLMSKECSEKECELLVDNEIVAGRFLLLEIANMPFVGPNLQLVPGVDPTDGVFDVMWIEGENRNQWCEYLELYRRGESATAPLQSRRCRRVLFRHVKTPIHVDGEVFKSISTPISIILQPHAVHVLDAPVEATPG